MLKEPLHITPAYRYGSNMIGIASMLGLFAVLVALGTKSFLFGLVCFSPTVFCALLWLAAENSSPTNILIDPIKNEVSVQYHSWSTKKDRTWSLSKWRSVHSYYTTEGLRNVVALRGSDQDFELLSLGIFDFTSEAKSWFSLPNPVENPEATALRKLISGTGLFEDRGFSSTEIAGNYVG